MKFLFICTHNACRSILAEAITRRLAGGRIEVASAGSQPAGRIHPSTLAYLQATDFPTGDLRSKGFDDLTGFRPDVVITVCDSAASESCPVWLTDDAITVHWGLPDPSHMQGTDAERMAAFGSVAGTIDARVSALLAEPFETMDRPALEQLLTALAGRWLSALSAVSVAHA